MIDKRWQTKGSYSDYQKRQSNRLLSQLSEEQKESLRIQIQARTQLMGEQVKNQEVFNQVMRRLA